ncbi:MAG: protein-disulfide oxidoreductase DsbI [Campylobacter sp.]|nr:protein-disulfide oxidoreductase DsbI [Campylobacter sp.]
MQFFKKINKWQDERLVWIFMAIICVLLVVIAHSFFQKYLYMPPCEQCVYIRVAFLIIAVGGIIVAINPKNIVLKIFGYIFGFWGGIYGAKCSLKLSKIHDIMRADDADPFGVLGCQLQPTHIFSLPLEKMAPQWFMPLGDCGKEDSILPEGVVLDPLQEFLINTYANAGGWYLLPSQKFLNMPECSLICFVLCLGILAIMALSFVLTRLKNQI